MNLSEHLCVDKELFSGELCSKENTVNNRNEMKVSRYSRNKILTKI